MRKVELVTDFILHIGMVDTTECCALVRLSGDEYIHKGYVSPDLGSANTTDLNIVTPSKIFTLSGVPPRHLKLIRTEGLYIIQRSDPLSESQSTLFGWREL